MNGNIKEVEIILKDINGEKTYYRREFINTKLQFHIEKFIAKLFKQLEK